LKIKSPIHAGFRRSGTLELSNSGESTVFWDFGDGSFSEEVNPSHLYTMEKDYQVVLKANGLSGSDVASEIIHICEMPTASFTFDLSPWGHLVTFDQSIKAKTYQWDFGDGTFSTEASPEHYYLQDGTYSILLIVYRGECTDTASAAVDVCIYPKADFYYEINGIEFSFFNTSVKADSLYWDFGDGFGSNLPNPVHSFNLTGEYNVLLRTFNECGQDSVTHMAYAAVEELEKDSRITIYPVPASDKLYILPELTSHEMTVTLYDPSGTIMLFLSKKTRSGEMTILDLESMVEGIYCLKLTFDDHIFVRKIIVMR